MPDTLGFLDAVAGLPEQLDAAHRAAVDAIPASALPAPESVRGLVVMGMGGSGISGDVVAAAYNDQIPVPVTVLKRYRVPAFVGPGTLALAVSYSGETEETVSMARAAADAGAALVAVSCGGTLAGVARDAGGLHVPCPPGYMPRAALGALVAPIVVTLGRLGMVAHGDLDLDEAVEVLARRRETCRPDVPAPANPAREMARLVDGTFPLFYGGGAMGSVAAYRWKCDVNENAKAPAFWAAHPELDHNEICGWGQHGDATRQVISLVELRHGFEHPQLVRRFEITRGIVEEAVNQVLEARAEGTSRLAQLLDLMYLGDWVSCYLALDAGVDPGPIEAIARLKAALAG